MTKQHPAAVHALDFPAHTAPAEKVLEALSVDPDTGLSEAEVQKRLTEYGPNRIKPPPKASLGRSSSGRSPTL
ncbi:calcium-transporting ATPase 3 [Trichosporon asahii var. asahii CBS 2479]|uniref:Calcium-transporting ATPase 3 n=1 Tax=Trichosporon asahii var. asahii (strain ATCC 90039 / CBS 2479 / JCM 2466 / KCTC 7840 / NBRC 103889/ NCYC 2677 / UAMH 7654) TaxID=1186058 RepID=J6EXI3_TRIAS|nr:calcium-transporting ATPase 3 [Trichosporon asahii var. asahii CBS 2479]EJT47517.1 calcium-transporting ATPase 3 [Trichosporon asahii var. asahii CBS 2479]